MFRTIAVAAAWGLAGAPVAIASATTAAPELAGAETTKAATHGAETTHNSSTHDVSNAKRHLERLAAHNMSSAHNASARNASNTTAGRNATNTTNGTAAASLADAAPMAASTAPIAVAIGAALLVGRATAWRHVRSVFAPFHPAGTPLAAAPAPRPSTSASHMGAGVCDPEAVVVQRGRSLSHHARVAKSEGTRTV
eukprot:CAMPEP_0176279702 /NCGR_PEP_ID=MMETSP0121_2-20121125/49417_1 /TAXON_ID=160619 /ORGANISM="Kryptoperidinium foliaceum, Strain CCMP 1326" /LENGTH=195 /DNA_ID=CAMNT_0017620017 /DNA_START=66 /DNA_END=652 /DNA_ORIENTATION=+